MKYIAKPFVVEVFDIQEIGSQVDGAIPVALKNGQNVVVPIDNWEHADQYVLVKEQHGKHAGREYRTVAG
jgi:hypothetical protein